MILLFSFFFLIQTIFFYPDDKLTRVRLLLEHVQKVSQQFYQPYDAVSVDERTVSSKHQYSGIRQFIRDKPIRFGLKLWVLADSLSGYTYSFYVYLGKKRTVLCQKTKGLAYNVVMELCQNLFHKDTEFIPIHFIPHNIFQKKNLSNWCCKAYK